MAQLNPTVAADYEEMSRFYDHIKDIFLDKDKYKVLRKSRTVRVLKFLTFVCVLPVMPAAGIFVCLGPEAFSGNGIRHIFLPIWVLSAVISLIWFAVERKREKARTHKEFRERFLPREQESFARAYSLYLQLSHYRSSQNPGQLKQALEYWESMMRDLDSLMMGNWKRVSYENRLSWWMLEYKYELRKRPRLLEELPDVNYFSDLTFWERLGWFKVESETDKIVKAFRKLPELYLYVSEHSDTDKLPELFFPLAFYLYSQIRDLRRDRETTKLIEAHGREELMRFASVAAELPNYEVAGKTGNAVTILERLGVVESRIAGMFASDSPLVRGAAYWVLTFAITLIGFLIIRLFASFEIGAEIIGLIITVPTLAAATAIAAPYVNNKGNTP